MANVPVAAVKVNTSSNQTGLTPVGKKPQSNQTPDVSSKHSKVTDRSNTVEKKSFSQILNSVKKENLKLSDKKAETDVSRRNRRNKLSLVSKRNPGLKTSEINLLSDAGKSDKAELADIHLVQIENENNQDNSHRIAESGLISLSISPDKQQVHQITVNNKSKISQKKKNSGVPGNRPLRNLSSSAARVKVIDNRVESASNVRSSPEHELGNLKTHAAENHTTEANRTKHSVHTDRRFSAEPVRLDHNPVAAETDIEISTRSEGKTFQKSAAAELARKLDAQAGNDIVRQVKVILNQANAGEVRINLRPDNLGQVRIRIRMEDNRLTGRIFVESAAAREAFRNALDGLQTRLVESGFGSADLEMAWDESPQSFMQSDEEPGNNGNQKSNTEEAIREFENIISTNVSSESVDGRVNMVV